MSDRNWMEPLVERVVGQVLESHAAQLRSEIVRRVMQEVAGQPAASSSAGSSAADLARGITDIQLGTSQKEILRALLEASSCCATRAALFIVKGGHATGWHGRGFDNGDAVKDFALDSSVPAVLRVIGDRVGTSAAGSEFDARFFGQFGAPAGEARILPLILKDKVAALVYADGGTGEGLFDSGALEVLVLSASAWLEVNALRKQVHKEPAAAPADGHSAPAQETTTAVAHNDPFAAHAPAYAMAAAASASSVEVQSAVATGPQTVAESSPVGHAHVESEARAESHSAAPEAGGEDRQTHTKAQRFARLLVDEIKLYNQAKVAEGRANNDLYDRLQDAIEKSRATYQKRYGNTVAASGNYFQHELLRSLAEDDVSVMGENFHL